MEEYLEKIPPEIIQNTLLNLDIGELNNVCRTSKSIQNICTDRIFWRDKFRRDNVPIIYPEDPYIQWKDFVGDNMDVNEYVNIYYFSQKIQRARRDADIILKNIKNDVYPEEWGVAFALLDLPKPYGIESVLDDDKDVIEKAYYRQRTGDEVEQGPNDQIIIQYKFPNYVVILESYSYSYIDNMWNVDDEYSGEWEVNEKTAMEIITMVLYDGLHIYDVNGKEVI